MKRKMIRGLACLFSLVMLSGCVKQGNVETKATATLAPAAVAYAAPDGVDMPVRTREGTLYLPGENELQLEGTRVWIRTDRLSATVQELTRLQLEALSDLLGEQLGGTRRLATYSNDTPEISGGICTVNLGTSALQLSNSEIYKVCVALATTLCDLDEISFTNVLIADQSVGMDITGSLAMGSLTGHPDENLPVLWEQMEAKRTPLGDDMSRTPLNALVTLYYPLQGGEGIGCENRILNFAGQTPQQLASELLDAVSAVHRGVYGEDGLPDLTGLLLHEPLASELEDGGRLITLSLRENTEGILRERGIDFTCLMAAVTYTLTTFIPGVAAVCVRIGDKPVTGLENRHTGAIPVLSGLLKRNLFEKMLMTGTTVFFARNGRLCRSERPLEQTRVDSPRAQLSVLLGGPDERETAQGMTAATPITVGEDDVLGIALADGTLLVNLSEGFRSEIQAFGRENEMLLCYSMVNTLCTNNGVKRVRFYFEGEQVETIAGEIYWGGDFYYNPVLEDNGLG